MFISVENRLLKFHVHGRITVDAAIFCKTNPNYLRLHIKKPDAVDFFFEHAKHGGPESQIRGKDIDFNTMKEEDLAICSLTVLRFSLNEKVRGEHYQAKSSINEY